MATETPKAKKSVVCTKMFVQSDGTETKSAHGDATELQFRFHDGKDGAVGTVRTVTLGMNPAYIEKCLDWAGRSHQYGDSYAGAGGNAVTALEKFDTRAEIYAGGEWKEKREGGEARPSMVLEAIVAALEADGATVDDDRKARIKEMVSTTEGRKKARANAKIEAHYQAIVAARAAEKAKAAKAAAKGDETDLSDF